MTPRASRKTGAREKPIGLIVRGWHGARQSARAALVGLCSVALVTGCSDLGDQPAPGVVAPNDGQGFIGGVAADEPVAAQVARDVLASGGTAADAAVALFFTLSVTFPSTASLGGGGACLVYRPSKKGDATEVLEFPARASRAQRDEATDRPTAVPSAVRGMAALHARYGAERWETLLSPAESLARFGYKASRAFARDLALAAGPLFEDGIARQQFTSSEGEPITEGQTIAALELAGVLSQLRTKGAGELYRGVLAQRLVDAVASIGGTLELADLQGVTPVWRPAQGLEIESNVLYAAPSPSEGGLTAVRLFAGLRDGDALASASPAERAHLIAETSQRAWLGRGDAGAEALDPESIERTMAGVDRSRHQAASNGEVARWPAENPAGTGFAIVDRAGMAVVCVVTLNNLFGTGRILPELGFPMAAAPREGMADPITSFTPALYVNHNSHQVLFVGVASGGAAAPSALGSVLAGVLIEQKPLREALAAPRVHHGGVPDRTYVEPGLSAVVPDLTSRGHQVDDVAEIGRVNAIACLEGLPRDPESCVFGTDPRGNGLAVGGVF